MPYYTISAIDMNTGDMSDETVEAADLETVGQVLAGRGLKIVTVLGVCESRPHILPNQPNLARHSPRLPNDSYRVAGTPRVEVVMAPRSSVSLTLGIIATILGVLALLIGWIPFLGMIAIPTAVIGALLAIAGFVAALFVGGRGIGLPMLGGVICVGAVILPIVSTAGTSRAIFEALDDASGQRVADAAQESRSEAAYINDHLVLYDITAKYMESYQGRVPGVLFKLRNDGSRSLDRVRVTIYFKDSAGRVIADEDFYPVLVSTYNFSGENKPLKAGYVWQMESGKFYSAKSVPSEWKEGSVVAKITDIEFSKPG